MCFCHVLKKSIKRAGLCKQPPFFLIFLLINQCFLLYLDAQKLPAKSAVKYHFGGVGRFGDQLIGYCKAKLISYWYDIPLLCKPMLYSENLALSQQEQFLNTQLEKKFLHKFYIRRSTKIKAIERNRPILYVVNMHSNIAGLIDKHKLKNNSYQVPVLNNVKYLENLRQSISLLPHVSIKEIYRPPTDQISVAVHVRTGGGFDCLFGYPQPDHNTSLNEKMYVDIKWPSKFPSKAFYIQQIRKISTMFSGKSLYIHIFTDDKNPALLVQEFQAELKDLPLTFATRCNNNTHDSNVLDDFFGMIKFDCLIRPKSSLSMVVEMLGNFKVVIAPQSAHWDNNQWVLSRLLVRDNRLY
jgi:hypothetical protein